MALCMGKATPWLDREQMPRAPPSANSLTFDEQSTRPDAGCPQRSASTSLGTRISRSTPCSKNQVSPLGKSRAGAAGTGAARKEGSSWLSIHPVPMGVRTCVATYQALRMHSYRNASDAAHVAKASAVVGPKTCKYRRTSSRAPRADPYWASARSKYRADANHPNEHRVPVGAA